MYIPFGEYRPDVSDYESQLTHTAQNVVPRGDGYGPFQTFSAFYGGAGNSKGFFYALKNDGSVAIFMATQTGLFLLNNASGSWSNISKGGGYTGPSSDKNWSFAQFNNYVIATNKNDPVQVYDLVAAGTFGDLGGSPPQADYVTVVNRFVVLSGIASPNVYRVQWSGLNATTTWTSGVNDSDFQDMADGGVVRGIAGGEVGYIFQDRSIRSMTFQAGSSIVFAIERISSNDGLLAPYSLVNASDRIFFYSPQGFKMYTGGQLTPIGKERVDRTFDADLDKSNLQLFIGAVDPRNQRVFWSYKSVNGASGAFDKMLCYDWVLDRWSGPISLSGQYITNLSVPGLTLEGVDAAYNSGTSTAVTIVGNTVTMPAHGLTAGQGIIFTAMAAGTFQTATPYYVSATSLTSNTFRLSASGGVGDFAGSTVTASSSGTASLQVSSIDTLNIDSLDNVAGNAEPALAAVDSSGQPGFFTGGNMEATLDTGFHGSGSLKRISARGFQPMTDSPVVYGSFIGRKNMVNTTAFPSEETQSTEGQLIEQTGYCATRMDGRFVKARVRIGANQTWSFASGVQPDFTIVGEGR